MQTPNTKAGQITERLMYRINAKWEQRHGTKLEAADYNSIYGAVLEQMEALAALEKPCSPRNS